MGRRFRVDPCHHAEIQQLRRRGIPVAGDRSAVSTLDQSDLRDLPGLSVPPEGDGEGPKEGSTPDHGAEAPRGNSAASAALGLG